MAALIVLFLFLKIK